MKRIAYVLLSLPLLLVMAPAWGKGPAPLEATITGPGLEAPITFSDRDGPMGTNADPDARRLALLTDQTEFWEGVYMDDRRPQRAPTGELGPRFTITWEVGMPGLEGARAQVFVSYLYPYAEVGPMVFTPRQRLDFGESGPSAFRIEPLWKASPEVLVDNLQGWGLPTVEELAPPAGPSEADPAPPPTGSMWPWLALAVAAGSVAAGVVRLASRDRPAT